ncbi:MAG: MFS transporter [Trebonia sp.]
MHIRKLGTRSLGRQFGWLWAAYAVSAYGSGFGFGAFPLIAIRVLHAGPLEVSALSAAGLAVGAMVAVPLGPWVEFRRKRPVMMTMDLTRFAALMTIPAAYALGWLSFAQLLVVSIVVAAAKIAFNAASGANLKTLVKREDLLVANGRFESTTWTALVVGPPLGGAAVGIFGPVITVTADAVSYLLSAAGIAAIGEREPRPERPAASRLRTDELLDGWRHILGSPALRPVFFNRLLVGGLILAAEPELAVLMLGPLRFAPWQYTLAFGAPCIGGFIGSRLASRLVVRFGQHRIMLVFGALGGLVPALAGLHRFWRGRRGARHGGAVRGRLRHGRVQPGGRHLPARSHGKAPRRPSACGLVGVDQPDHRRSYRRMGRACHPHQPAHRDRRRGRSPAGYPAAAAAPRARARAGPRRGRTG